ncbi:MAG: hypothetical protein Q7R33_06060 [Nitrosarchaeum sp.]|nr:hypothetical protein [Nitrosarchaeum sp.]
MNDRRQKFLNDLELKSNDLDETVNLDDQDTVFKSTDEQDVEIVASTESTDAEPVEVIDDDEPPVSEEDIHEETEKKTDNEIIADYLKPNGRCILCTTPIWSVKLNKAFLDGESYTTMIEKYSAKFEERTSRSLNKSLLHRHFKSHFDVRAAAIAEYNKRRSMIACNINPSTAQRDIFKLATAKYLDELEIFDTTAKELITKYQELESIIEERKNSDKTHGIDELIIKQASILNSLNKQAISKFKALSKVDLESKQGQYLTQLSFIGNKAIAGMTQVDKKLLLSPKDVEETYLGVVIHQMLARIDGSLKILMPAISADEKSLFYRELKKSIEGMQEGINLEFDRQIKSKSQKMLTDKQDSQH